MARSKLSTKYSKEECAKLWRIYLEVNKVSENMSLDEWSETIAARFNFGVPKKFQRSKQSLRRKVLELHQKVKEERERNNRVFWI